MAADSQTAALSDNANANIAQGGYAEDLVAADLENRTQAIDYHDGADGGSERRGRLRGRLVAHRPVACGDGSLGR